MDDRTSDPLSPHEPPALPPRHAPAAVETLKDAMRRARSDDAERASVMADMRAARIARLEILQDALKPLVAQIPADCDLFDVGLMPGVNPRLFIDMIGFVEMGRDARIYHFLQDTRHGRVKIAESASVETVVDAITDYVARRLLERDKALAADAFEPREFKTTVHPKTAFASQTTVDSKAGGTKPPTVVAPMPKEGVLRWASIVFAFVIDLLGAIAFFSILAWGGWFLYNRLHGNVG